MAAAHLNLLRHADAGDPLAWRGDDADRPLSAKGIAQAERLAEHLAAVGFGPDLLITSPKVRAHQTAEAVTKRLKTKLIIDDRLAWGIDIADVEAMLREHGDLRDVLLVGHDPDFSEVLSMLVGAELPMKKGAFARLEVERPLQAGEARLQWLLPPGALPGR
jgi:phosphohistidine phosphatase